LRIALTADPELPVPPLHYGGIERIVDMLARSLVARGHEVTLFSSPQSICPVRRVGWAGLSSVGRLDTVRNTAQLGRYITMGRFDIVHSFSRLAYLTPVLPFAIPKLMSFQREITPRTTGLAHRLSRGSLEFSAISRQMIEARPLSGRWHLVPNGVPLETYTFRAAVPSDAPLVFLGRLEEIKGPHLAIEVARLTGLKLVLAGNVPEAHRRWFETRIHPQIDNDLVRYVGPVDDKQKNRLLGEARALLMPILFDEPFGIVMVEAMACGTPVLGLRRGSVPEVVENGVTGFVLDTVDELAIAIGRIAAIERTACRARVELLYSDRAVTEGYTSLYEDMITRARATGRASRTSSVAGISH
jgi:glycosyltransferase involved in cell wall biosynthesis